MNFHDALLQSPEAKYLEFVDLTESANRQRIQAAKKYRMESRVKATKVRVILAVGTLLLLGSWLWIGFDKYVGDHEVGSAWEPFLKSRPTLTVLFTNPAQQGLDRDAFDAMDAARQQAFRDYCAIRFGIADPHRCEQAVEDRRL